MIDECEYSEYGICVHPRALYLKKCPIANNPNATCSRFKKSESIEELESGI